MKQRRNRIEGRIKGLAKRDPEAASELATHGRKLTATEQTVWHYLYGRQWGDTDFADDLCQLLVAASRRNDKKALADIARAIRDFDPSRVPADQERAYILCLKKILLARGGQMTIRRLAALLRRKRVGDHLIERSDGGGFSALRAKAKSLGFPIQKAK